MRSRVRRPRARRWMATGTARRPSTGAGWAGNWRDGTSLPELAPLPHDPPAHHGHHGAAIQPAAGERRVAALGDEGRGVHDPFLIRIEDRDVRGRAWRERAARELESTCRRAT